MRRILIFLMLFAAPAAAQDDDRGYLTAFLEDNLSGIGREVTITGFAGALSSQATIESLTIADEQGIWLTLNGIVLDWSRSSLLSGEVVVNELSADEIIVARAPATDEATLPEPEAKGFNLPELPVSINIGRIAAERIILEPALLGQKVEGSLEAALTLAGGEGVASFALLRSDDGPEGRITLEASYSNSDRQLDLALLAKEGDGGLATTLLGLPGAPAVDLSVLGSGPIDDFSADILLSTDGAERLSGSVTLGADSAGGNRFSADLSGDLAPLFLPEYAEFFGPDVALVTEGTRSASGRLSLQDFAVRTRSLALSGAATFAPDGLPETLILNGRLASPDGARVLLPLSGEPTRVRSAEVDLDYIQGDDAGWKGAFTFVDLERADFAAQRFSLRGSGRIGRTDAGRNFGATIKFDATGLQPADEGLAAALGQAISGSVVAYWREGEPALSVPDLRLVGEDYDGRARLRIEGLNEALLTTGRIELSARDFSRFALLAGRPLAGAGKAVVEGSASRLSGALDLVASFEGQGLQVGIDQIDQLLDGKSNLTASVLRDETGTTLRSFGIAAKTLAVTGAGKISSLGSDLAARLEVTDLSALGPRFRGAVSLDAGFTGTLADGLITTKGIGSGLGIGQAEADRLLAGQSNLAATVAIKDGALQIEDATITNPQASLTAKGSIAGALRQIDLQARLANLAILVPGFPGALTVSGTAIQDEAGYQLDLASKGPGQVDATVSGRLSNSLSSADLKLSGTGQAALANIFLDPRAISGPVRFDLRLNGPPRLTSLTGRVSLAGGRLTDPSLGFAFERTEAILDLLGGSARISATTEPSSGGRIRIDGPVALAAPYQADLAVTLDRVRLVDPELYQTTANGALTVSGPLARGALIAGRINLSETEVRVPSSGFGGDGGLPGLRHTSEPGDVQNTRRKAGLLGDGSGRAGTDGEGGDFRLDLEILAPNRVFIRGRGIDAELGGALRLSGTTSAVIPSGGFQLIRGRLDILGKRLVLNAADLRLEGNLVPDILVSASTESDGITSFVTVEGPADAPTVSFSSVPELPQEEVLARLLFGRGLDTISALQAVQLANAVAVLAGRSGEGLIGRLRQGFGLDDLDVVTADDGSAALKAGKYISENVYTEVEVDQDGKSQINLNLDLRPGVTVKGRVAADGETGIGIFVERDY